MSSEARVDSWGYEILSRGTQEEHTTPSSRVGPLQKKFAIEISTKPCSAQYLLFHHRRIATIKPALDAAERQVDAVQAELWSKNAVGRRARSTTTAKARSVQFPGVDGGRPLKPKSDNAHLFEGTVVLSAQLKACSVSRFRARRWVNLIDTLYILY
ncbi:hypothetical protein EDB83DRAFT_2533576 [Lactarius deliciosus]|nr:hypothetical protein EDB83DRAFT_2533576 [Lactarius deliciosus]